MGIKKKTNEFKTQSPDGKMVIIYEFTEFLDAGSFEKPDAIVEGLKSFYTADGKHVNFITESEYKVVETGIALRRV